MPITDGAGAFNWLYHNSAANWQLEPTRDFLVPCPFKVAKYRIEHDLAPGVGNSYDYTIRRNGSDTELKLSIVDAALDAEDATHVEHFNDADSIATRLVAHNTPTPPTNLKAKGHIEIEGYRSFPIMQGISTNPSNSANSYLTLMGTAVETVLDAAVAPIPIGCTLRRLIVRTTSTITTGSYDFTIMKGTTVADIADTPLLAHISPAVGFVFGRDYQHSVHFNPGDLFVIKLSPTGTPTATSFRISMECIPDNDGESFLVYSSSAAPANNATRYEAFNGRGANSWTNAENTRQGLALAGYTATAMYVVLGTAPGAGKSWQIALRNGSTTTAVSTTVADDAPGGLAGNITGQSVALADNDLINLVSIPTGTPAPLTNGVHVGVALSGPISAKKKIWLDL